MYVSDIVNSTFHHHHFLPWVHHVPEVIVNHVPPPPMHVVDVDQYIINIHPPVDYVAMSPFSIDHIVDAVV